MSDELTHYMESTSRLKLELEAERENNREDLATAQRQAEYNIERAEAAEATMREVAEELREWGKHTRETWCFDLADRLDPPPVVENPPA